MMGLTSDLLYGEHESWHWRQIEVDNGTNDSSMGDNIVHHH